MRFGKFFKRVCLGFAVVIWGVSTQAVGHDLVIYHTNDVHGYAFEERGGDGQLVRIGYDRLKAVVDGDASSHKLLLDAGDVLHGQAFATARRGDLMALVLSFAGYDALAAGNHDFDYGYERLLSLAEKYRLNFLAANVTKKSGEHVLPPYLVRSWGDLKVGVFGLSTPETTTSTDPRNVAELTFKDPIAGAAETVKRLKAEGVDLIVAVTHMGSEPYCVPMSQTIAEKVPGIDLIVDGHSHSKASVSIKGEDGHQTLIVSTGSYFANLGKVTADRKLEGGFTLSAELIPAKELETVSPDAAMREAMNALRTELDRELGQVVLNVPFDLDGSRQNVRSASTNLGRIICASLTDATGADAALLNGGSIRDSIAAGDVTKGQLLSVLPYGNYIFIVEITGKDLLEALNHGLGLPGAGAFPQFWGMEVTAEKKEITAGDGTKSEVLTARSVTVGGKPLNPETKYTLAINDFLYSGGDGYEMFKNYGYREFATLEEVFRKFVTEKGADALKAISDANVLSVETK